MKKFNLYLLLFMLVFIPTLQSCDNDDGYSLDNFAIAMATVKTDAGNSVYFVLDNGETLWPAASLVPFRELEDGTRIIGNFTILSDAQNGFDHFVRLNSYSKVLTKDIINLTEANKDSIGDDKVRITDMWVSDNYLNVEFDMNIPSVQKHRVNLVRNTMQNYTEDGYVHLEFRYNDMDDVTGYIARSIVSFRLGNSGPSNVNLQGLKVRINSAVNGETIIPIEYKTKVSTYATSNKSFETYNLENVK